MGTLLQVSVADQDGELTAKPESLIELAFSEAGRLEALLTRYQAGSPMHSQNTHGSIYSTPEELRYVLIAALRHHQDFVEGLPSFLK